MAARHARARQHLHPKPATQPLDYVVYFFSFATPLFEIPQAYTIYVSRDAHGVSLWTWGFFVLDNLAWIIYAWRRKLWPVLFTSILYELIEVSVVIGIVRYG